MRRDEFRAQVEVVAWLEGCWPELYFYSVPNEGRRSPAGGHNMKLKGLKAGAPDLCLPLKRLAWGALYIEMKKPQGPKPRGKQLEAREMLTSQGQLVVSCQGSEKAKEIITMYLQATQEQILRYIGQNPEIKSGEARDMSGHAVKELPGRRLHEKVL